MTPEEKQTILMAIDLEIDAFMRDLINRPVQKDFEGSAYKVDPRELWLKRLLASRKAMERVK